MRQAKHGMSATSPSDPAARDAVVSGAASRTPADTHIKHMLLRELFGPRKPLLVGHLVGAALFVVLLWDSAPQGRLAVWCALIAGVTLLRLLLVQRFNARPRGPEATVFWTWAYAAGAFAAGSLWGASAGLFPVTGTSSNQTFILIIAGMFAAGLSGYAVRPLVFTAFIVPATLPFGWHLFHVSGAFLPGSAALFATALTTVIAAAFWRERRVAAEIERNDAEAARLMRIELDRENARRDSAEKGRALAQLSHELRTPLNAIVGFSEAIKHGVFGPVGNPRYSAYADNIHDSGRHLLAVIERALAQRTFASEMPAMTETDVDLGEIAAEAAAMFETRARQRSVALVVAVEEPPPCIQANGEKLRQVLINLLSNAIKFTPPRGRITIEVTTPRGEGVVLRVADTGVGMEPAQIARALSAGPAERRAEHGAAPIFENSRGVGLLITKWLTELHGGSLAVESVKNAGTTVTVRLPPERLLLRVRAPESRGPLRAAAE